LKTILPRGGRFAARTDRLRLRKKRQKSRAVAARKNGTVGRESRINFGGGHLLLLICVKSVFHLCPICG
jgi:type II secretory pathway component PulM